ncbi:hypothetical protein CBS101457_003528 [Exobasidium rhododendri]|nr:hypothetical protein CBS101457_003528 [Exobasidium rhododendri]
MANSLTDWLSSQIKSSISAIDTDSKVAASKVSLLDDIAFLKGRKVQIVRFYTPQAAALASREVHKSLELDAIETQSIESDEGLWAVVADKIHSVTIKFSHSCVSNFNHTHFRELISLRGTIIALKSFRPSISFLPSLLESNTRRGGPFAPPQLIVNAALFLDVEAFQVLGSINEVIFWKSEDLHQSLVKDQAGFKSYRSWFKKVEKLLERERRRQMRAANKLELPGVSHTEASQSSNEKSTDSTRDSGSNTIVTTLPPPPFQNPVQSKKKRDRSYSQEAQMSEANLSKRAKSKAMWDNFQLSEDEDEFGLNAAAKEVFDMHKRGGKTTEEESFPLQQDDDILEESFSFLTGERIPSSDSLESQSHSYRDSNILQSSADSLSSNASLPATHPNITQARQALNVDFNSPAIVIEQEGYSSGVRPPNVIGINSLPFSFLLDQGVAEKVMVQGDGDALGEEDGSVMPVQMHLPATGGTSEKSAADKNTARPGVEGIAAMEEGERKDAIISPAASSISAAPSSKFKVLNAPPSAAQKPGNASATDDAGQRTEKKRWFVLQKITKQEKEEREKAEIKRLMTEIVFDC